MVVTTPGGSQGGVGLVVRESPEGWSVESTCFHGPNVVIYEILSDGQRTSSIGAYLSFSTIDHLLDLEDVLNDSRGGTSLS